ncbi:MAG TPA: hypothetical protein VLK33_09535, partial [Terriglobales bacterium]|nr:hypothetical protein [Terriglobales bacterium]
MQYARLVHDYQWMSFKSRTATPGWAGFSSTPETVPFCLHPNQGAPKDEIKLNEEWTEFTRGVNSPAG